MTAGTSVDKIRIDNESLCNVRINCLRAAADMLKETTLLPEQKVSLAIKMAESFERYVLLPVKDYTPDGVRTVPESDQPSNKKEVKT